MIWLTWRQLRVQAVAVLGVLAAAAVLLAITGPQLSDLLRVYGADFFDRLGADGTKKAIYEAGTVVVYAVPAVVGVFWGAPMVARELEAGTFRLVWGQSITRTRWLATKLAIAGTCAALAGLSGLALTRWCAPLDRAIAKGYNDRGTFSTPRLWPALFGARGTVPLGMTILALVVGVAAGMLLRRTVAAMAATLVLVVAVQIVMPVLVQAHLLTPKQLITTITQDNITELSISSPDSGIERLGVSVDSPGAWITGSETVDASGTVVTRLPGWTRDCAAPPGQGSTSTDACLQRLADEGYRQHVAYVPASRFWALQLVETGILLGLALVLAAFSFWRIRRDFS